MSKRITVHENQTPIYDILLEDSFEALPVELIRLGSEKRRLCIVTDSNVEQYYLTEVKERLADCCRQVVSFTFPAGEEHKNLDTVKQLYEFLIRSKFDRGDWLIALGGGVVGDLCGYTAATYLRGISFVQIPTTLLSQVDSGIGGKTGVDFDSYKNMVGAFHMPLLVYSNTRTLLTLPEEQFSAGMGEIIKHGLIKNGSYYQWLQDHASQINARDLAVCETMILESDQIKRNVVEQDPKEQGERALLNFGHTLGHAIEKLMDFTWLHGHCVGLGCLAAAYISEKRGMITKEETKRLKEVLEEFRIPVSIQGLDPEQAVTATKNDKKMDGGVIKFILLKQVGEAYVDRTVTEDEMRYALSRILDERS
ncbi:MAG: 3-dehydroquinate synthase [Lachnospiraceae bacterium]